MQPRQPEPGQRPTSDSERHRDHGLEPSDDLVRPWDSSWQVDPARNQKVVSVLRFVLGQNHDMAHHVMVECRLVAKVRVVARPDQTSWPGRAAGRLSGCRLD